MPPTIPMSALVVEALDLANPTSAKCKSSHNFSRINEEFELECSENQILHTRTIVNKVRQLSNRPIGPTSPVVRKSLVNEEKEINKLPCPFTNPSLTAKVPEIGTATTSLFSKIIISSNMIDMETVKELLAAIVYAVYGIIVAVVMTLFPRRFRYKNVSGQVVLVTGAGSGIGRLMAKKFALTHGAIVVAWDINKQGNEETVRDIRSFGGKCHGYTVDVSSRESIYEMAKKVRAEVGKVDILINNAGIVSGNKILETTDAQIEKTFQVNSLSNFWTTKAFLPDMQKTGRGHIVTIASLAGMFGTSKLVDYCASKYAAVGFDEALRNELKCDESTKNLNTTLVCPYYINTGMFDGVRSKIVPILMPEPVVNDIVAGVLTNQECIIIPRYVYLLILIKNVVPGEVGRRLASAFGFNSGMVNFRGRAPVPVKNGSK